MNFLRLFTRNRARLTAGFAVFLRVVVVASVALAAPGQVVITPDVPLELPVEVETELGPAGSLKQAPLWKEIIQMLEDPYAQTCVPSDNTAGQDCVATIERRPGFGADMPPLNVYPLDFTVQTGQPLRLRTSDGEVSWEQPGPLFENGEFPDPTTRPIIGYLMVEDETFDPACEGNGGCLVVSNPDGHPDIPPDGTIVAVPAMIDGELFEYDPDTGDREEVEELEAPINEEDFFRPASDTTGVPTPFQPYIGRLGAEVLGKALFWDMQVGSDGVQSCGTCHFSAGADTRTKNQLNPDHLGGDTSLEIAGPNEDLVPGDFPFHKLADPDIPGEPLLNPGNVTSDSNDITSSMGVRFRQFSNIPTIGSGSFGPSSSGIRPLRPDIGTTVPDPIPVFQGLRRVEPRNTPTMISAAFNFDNFWDGRARFNFNGGSVFGPADPQSHVFIDPGVPGNIGGPLEGATNGHIHPDLLVENPEAAEQPVRIKFSSLASQATGPVLSDFEMSFAGRNWAKVAKKLLQNQVTPLANQLVAVDDSRLGPFSNQGGSACAILGRATAAFRPGLCVSYVELIQLSFDRHLWHNTTQHLNGASAVCTSAENGELTPPDCDPFDGYRLTLAGGAASPTNRDQFRQIEANFTLFFGLSVQAYEQLLIPDDTPFDRFMDANPRAGNGVGQPGEQGVLPPDQVADLVGPLTMVEGFGPDELFGFDIFAGANLTAALPVGSARNPDGVGSNPFLRTARCMLCHLGPEQTDHTSSVAHGLLLSDTEFELPAPGAAEPTGPFKFVTGFVLADELEEVAQDGVEVENRNFSILPQIPPGTSYDPALAPYATQIGLPNGVAFQDNGVYNIGLRPTSDDIGRGGTDAFGWPLLLASLALKNLEGADYESGPLSNFDPDVEGFGLYEETGANQQINPGLGMEPANPMLPEYMAPWTNNLPAGELSPQIDELAFAPNHLTHPPFAEFTEIQFGSDQNCLFQGDPNNPVDVAANDWGDRCPNTQTAVPNNFDPTLNGTWPFENRVAGDGAMKAPQLRNVELTGPYFHTGSYLTLRQVIDFYIRGGDFPITNANDRDPNLVNIEEQVFGFGSTNAIGDAPGIILDGVPDVITRYDAMPDTDQATPEYATPEDAREALVKFLLALTDERVKFEQAPFDHPEIFVPLDGTAPDNTFGRSGFLSRLSGVCPGGTGPCFLRVPATGAGGRTTPVAAFMSISSTPVAGPNNDHFDR